jgi:hypothetical protein
MRGLSIAQSHTFFSQRPENNGPRAEQSDWIQPRAILLAHMHITKRHLPKHRRARLIAWTLAMLVWLAQLFGGAAFTPRHERQRSRAMSLAGLTRMVKMLMLSRAADLARLRARKRYASAHRGRSLARRGRVRAIMGSYARRALKRPTINARIAALIEAIRSIDLYAAHIAKRMRRGQTRRYMDTFALTPALSTPLAPLCEPQAAITDSS